VRLASIKIPVTHHARDAVFKATKIFTQLTHYCLHLQSMCFDVVSYAGRGGDLGGTGGTVPQKI